VFIERTTSFLHRIKSYNPNFYFLVAFMLKEKKQFEEAEKKYLEAIEIKKTAFSENSMAVCVSLSNLADLYLSWKKYDKARATANRMLAAAVAIKSNEQQRIAKEILFDVSKESGVADSNAGLRQNKVIRICQS
jgi:tetratricopeptide (TPR) repeat protein